MKQLTSAHLKEVQDKIGFGGNKEYKEVVSNICRIEQKSTEENKAVRLCSEESTRVETIKMNSFFFPAKDSRG